MKHQLTNMDQIAIMQDEEIINNINRLEEMKKQSKNSKAIEVEIAYFQREQSIRNARKSFNANH
jgi:hypothetical protein